MFIYLIKTFTPMFQYTLETFAEGRETKWTSVPFTGTVCFAKTDFPAVWSGNTHKKKFFEKLIFSCCQQFWGIKTYLVVPSYVFFLLATRLKLVVYMLILEM